ncbi:immunoglobulin-like domain-containing protein, partial [Aliarcobacter vitoriensis]
MANLGKIQSIQDGKFYVKDALGNLVELKVGDVVNQNDVIVASNSNSDLSKLEIAFDNNQVIAFNQGELNLDSTLFENNFGDEELTFDAEAVNETLSAWNTAQENIEDMETAAGDVTEQATNAGNEENQDGGALRSKFSSRDGDSADVISNLRELEPLDGNTQEIENSELLADLLNTTDTPEIPTAPVDTRVPASIITLSNPTVYEGKDITITATVTNAPQTDLIITLNNGSTITILAGQTSGSTTFTNPNSEDVYEDSSTETYTITTTTGGNYISLDTNSSSTVTITDTIDTTDYTLTSTASGDEESAEITYTVTFTNPTTQAETV